MIGRPFRRLLIGLLIALGLLWTQTVVFDPCKNLTPDDWFQWWLHSCGDRDAGGGSGGAG